MCDFSLMHLKSRPARVADKIISKDFGTGTKGFCGIDEAEANGRDCTAVCLLPGTEIAFDKPVVQPRYLLKDKEFGTVAIFRQINKEFTHAHHDALEFPDGQVVLLTSIASGQTATVLQLPAEPKTEKEEIDQKRVEIVA